MSDTIERDSGVLQKLVDLIAKLELKVKGTIRTPNADYELETYYGEVVIEDLDGNEVVAAEIETYDS